MNLFQVWRLIGFIVFGSFSITFGSAIVMGYHQTFWPLYFTVVILAVICSVHMLIGELMSRRTTREQETNV